VHPLLPLLVTRAFPSFAGGVFELRYDNGHVERQQSLSQAVR
jgi:hypothetical protein